MSDRHLVAPDEVRALSARSDARGFARLGVHLALIAASATLVGLARATWWLLLPAMALHGWFLVALFACVHETSHHTAFASRRVNVVVGWLAGLPALLNWHFYQRFHLVHHRHTQDRALDPELDPPPPATRREYLRRLSGLPTWIMRVRLLARLVADRAEGFAFIPAAERATVVASARLMLAAYLLIVAVAFAAGDLPALLVWWIVPVLLAMPLLRAWMTAEHTGCPHDADPFANTRTMIVAAPLRLPMWNMPFHAEHHLHPSVPFHALPALHERVKDRLAAVASGYAAVNLALFRALP